MKTILLSLWRRLLALFRGRAMRPISTAEEIAHALGGKRSGNGYTCRCPIHGGVSLVVRAGTSGFPFIKCHGNNCEREDIYRALKEQFGLQLPAGDGIARDSKGSEWVTVDGVTYPADLGRLDAVYEYEDEDGAILHRKLRFEPKKFMQQFRNTNAKWIWKQDDWDRPRLVLYRLRRVLQTCKDGGVVFFCEGEKDADNLHMWFNLCATSEPMGAGKPWQTEWTTFLQGAKGIVIIGDNDDPGRRHMEHRASVLTTLGFSVKAFCLPGGGKDFTDFVERGGTKEDFMGICEDAPVWVPPEFQPNELQLPVAPLTSYNKEYFQKIAEGGVLDTDMVNAKRLAHHFGGELLHTRERGWLSWTGTHYEEDSVGRAQELAKETVRRISDEVGCAPYTMRRQLEKHGPASQGIGSLGSMLRMAATAPEFSCKLVEMDAEPTKMLFNCQNGTLNLETGELLRHRQEDKITRLSPVEYDNTAKCPQWLDHLKYIFGEDQELIDYWQKLSGYILTGRTDIHMMAYLWGGGKNGKSVNVEVLQRILGTYSLSTPSNTFMQQQQRGIPNDIARMAGSRLVVASELNSGERLDESLVKQVTGGDPVTARFLNREFFDFVPQFKLLMTGNSLPRIAGMDYGIRRRIHLIPFLVQIPVKRRILKFGEILSKTEGAGILNWMVQGCLDWQQEGLTMPKCVEAATEEYFSSQDPVKRFLDARASLPPEGMDPDVYFIAVKDFYSAYREHCTDSGVRYILDLSRFSEILKLKGHPIDQPKASILKVDCYMGISLKNGGLKDA